MNTEILGVVLMFVATVVLAIPLGKYIAKVYAGERSALDFFAPLENFFFRICGVDAKKGNELETNTGSIAHHQSCLVCLWICDVVDSRFIYMEP